MKKKNIEVCNPLHKDIARVGTGQFDNYNIKTFEAIAISIVAVLSITAGTIYGSILF